MMTGAQWEHGKTFPIYLPDIKTSPYKIAREGKRTPKSPALPWLMMTPHAQQARINHHHSLETLAIRGGLDWSEVLAVLQDRPWARTPSKSAQATVQALLADFLHPHSRMAA